MKFDSADRIVMSWIPFRIVAVSSVDETRTWLSRGKAVCTK